VWCLSWDEEEEHGADVVSYDILSHDYSSRARRDVVEVPDTVLCDASDAAEAYADYVHSQRDGYESSWPLVFRVCSPDGSISDFEVDREYVPEFSASPVKSVKPAAEEDAA
jgi:fibronectin type 3 domain-containing protein